MAPHERMVRDGLTVGLIAYASVAVFYASFDFLAARGTLFTVDMLSRSVFRGAPDPAMLYFPTTPDTLAISWYNLLHLLVSLAIGLTVVGLVELAERRPRRARLATVAIVAGYIVTILMVGFLSRTIRHVLPWWTIVAVNTMAVLAAGAYLTRKRPGIGRQMLGWG